MRSSTKYFLLLRGCTTSNRIHSIPSFSIKYYRSWNKIKDNKKTYICPQKKHSYDDSPDYMCVGLTRMFGAFDFFFLFGNVFVN